MKLFKTHADELCLGQELCFGISFEHNGEMYRTSCSMKLGENNKKVSEIIRNFADKIETIESRIK